MTIRWRLATLAIQLLLLGLGTYVVTGRPYSGEAWFFAGLLAAAINPQLLEPYYPRPSDVVGNAIVFLILYLTTDKGPTARGWDVLAVVLGVFLIFALAALILGAGRKGGRFVGLAKAARLFSNLASARRIYSAVFFLAALGYDLTLGWRFWTLLGVWAAVTAVGIVDWRMIWKSASGQMETATAQSMIGPSSILLSADEIPRPGTWVSISGRNAEAEGVVINRIRRLEDTWGQVHIQDSNQCEAILEGEALSLAALERPVRDLMGSVDAGSTDHRLRFTATTPLEIGEVVAVPNPGAQEQVIYQIASGLVERLDVKGGSHLVVAAHANQLGIFDSKSQRFRRHRWVPAPGAPVWGGGGMVMSDDGKTPDNSLLLGHVIGTDVPIFLDCKAASEGHVAILGMTKMGKSTLAERIAQELGKARRVTILDQTGEYVSKKGFPTCTKEVDWTTPGISVFEPKPGEVPAERAHEFLKYLVDQAVEEYKLGSTTPRSVIIDEAHQFIPEPAGLGFNAPGRNSSYAIGLLLMQIRKYGISVILVSQRTAVVAKSALSQCENLIAFRSVDQTGLDYLEAIAGSDVRDFLPQLRQGEALVFGPAMSSDSAVGIRVERP